MEKNTGSKEGRIGAETKARVMSVRIGDDLVASLQALAVTRQISLSATLRSAAEMYLQREQFSVGLKEFEERILVSLNTNRKETYKVNEDVQLLIAMFDQLTKFLMFSTPEVLDKEGMGALGNRRYNAFVAELHNAFYVRRKTARLAIELEKMDMEEQ